MTQHDNGSDEGYQLADIPEGSETQAPDDNLRRTFINLSEKTRRASVDGLNQLLVDTIMIRDMYKKHHWQLSGPTFYQLHLLFDEHFEAQTEFVDEIAERVQILGGIALGMPNDVAKMTQIDHPPAGREEPNVQITRLLNAHKTILANAHELAETAAENGDAATEDMVVGQIIAGNEMQAWFIAEHLVPTHLQADK